MIPARFARALGLFVHQIEVISDTWLRNTEFDLNRNDRHEKEQRARTKVSIPVENPYNPGLPNRGS